MINNVREMEKALGKIEKITKSEKNRNIIRKSIVAVLILKKLKNFLIKI